jgi:hypothetical protein
MRRYLAQENRHDQVDDEVHEVGGVRELQRMRRGKVEPVEGEHARHSDRDRVRHAREPRDRGQGDETNSAQERGDDVGIDVRENYGSQHKYAGARHERQHDLRAEREPAGPLPWGHGIRLPAARWSRP